MGEGADDGVRVNVDTNPDEAGTTVNTGDDAKVEVNEGDTKEDKPEE